MDFQVAHSPLKTAYGDFEFSCFSWGGHEEENVLCLRVDKGAAVPLVRLQSACFTAEIFRSTDCDCHEQLELALKRIQAEGGLFLYLLQDGRGAGIFLKTRALGLWATKRVDTADAYKLMGLLPDPREYDKAAAVLGYFGTRSVALLTNNPRKVDGLIARGLTVSRVPLEITPTSDSICYLRTKRDKLGHLLTLDKDIDGPQ